MTLLFKLAKNVVMVVVDAKCSQMVLKCASTVKKGNSSMVTPVLELVLTASTLKLINAKNVARVVLLVMLHLV